MYASAWDKANVKQCASPLMSSTASESDGRAVVFLVETSDEKIPPVSSLGKATKALHSRYYLACVTAYVRSFSRTLLLDTSLEMRV